MVIKDILEKAVIELKNAGVDAPVMEAGALLCYVLKKDKSYIYSHRDYNLSDFLTNEFFELIEQRKKRKPYQYITGQQEFMSLNFMVNPNVLIPRQETEILVETLIQYCRTKGKVDILDIGTGSGCIAVSLAYYIKECSVTAIDISDEALNVAKFNAITNGVKEKINFLVCDILQETNLSAGASYDIVVSNPPYIVTDEIPKLQKEVREYEPRIALDGGEDGLLFYRKITEKASEVLKPGGLLAFEIGYNQGKDVSKIMEVKFSDIKVIKDLSGNDRVVTGYLKLLLK
ncbi:MAG TPA: peptide chain release factor N(5)-glutamine methyltransferase [Clostridiaceae bacterium]|nr:peptide chain release factor N(5)-glutamine methyltransferase [Clostridiaceae bacterium]